MEEHYEPSNLEDLKIAKKDVATIACQIRKDISLAKKTNVLPSDLFVSVKTKRFAGGQSIYGSVTDGTSDDIIKLLEAMIHRYQITTVYPYDNHKSRNYHCFLEILQPKIKKQKI